MGVPVERCVGPVESLSGSFSERRIPPLYRPTPMTNHSVGYRVDGKPLSAVTQEDFFVFLYLTAGNQWEAPDGWIGLQPQLFLNLENQTPYSMYNGASFVSTEVSEIEHSKFYVVVCCPEVSLQTKCSAFV